MFRPMRRSGQQLELKECLEILKTEPRGVLSLLGDNGYIPMVSLWTTGTVRKMAGSIFTVQKAGIRSTPCASAIRLPTVSMTGAFAKKENGP